MHNKVSVELIFESFPVISITLYIAWKAITDFDPRGWNSFLLHVIFEQSINMSNKLQMHKPKANLTQYHKRVYYDYKDL